jgi:peptide-methionine (S)-S-oxide reductase
MLKRLLFLIGVSVLTPVAAQQKLETAIFAAGCFWCTEATFEHVPGVVSAVSGYIGGTAPNPSYEQVSSGGTGYVEAVEVTFDPAKVSYEHLLDVFWVNHDPTYLDRQFCDHGSNYKPGIYYLGDEQKRLAEASKAKYEKLKTFSRPILTPILKATKFWPAEGYHQDYYKKNPVRYTYYVTGCGRYARLDDLWGDLRKH